MKKMLSQTFGIVLLVNILDSIFHKCILLHLFCGFVSLREYKSLEKLQKWRYRKIFLVTQLVNRSVYCETT